MVRGQERLFIGEGETSVEVETLGLKEAME